MNKDALTSFNSLRNTVGVLGILLPVIIVLMHGGLLASVSLFYYSKAAVYFIAFLSLLGVFMLNYKGYEKKADEKISDNAISSIAGILALLIVVFPTNCTIEKSEFCNSFISGGFPLYGHNDKLVQIIHVISALGFFIIMAIISYLKFTRGDLSDPLKLKKNKIHRISAITIITSLVLFAIERIAKISVTPYDVFFLESIAIWAFGISWLVKGGLIKVRH